MEALDGNAIGAFLLEVSLGAKMTTHDRCLRELRGDRIVAGFEVYPPLAGHGCAVPGLRWRVDGARHGA